ncbi:MAG: cell division ATP-binding protein FtsE [Candidatus Nephthysia bennettiae]|nr:MAG: cell division ATP-binding protein FtsE [Candidatus Dormibacteraeota bacterium]
MGTAASVISTLVHAVGGTSREVEERRPEAIAARPGSIQLRDVAVGYARNPVFTQLDFNVEPGEFVYLVGPSGVGKTTLLKVLYGMVRPQQGHAFVDGVAVHRLHRWQTAKVRRRVGCIFQNYELLPHLTAFQNVLLPLQLGHPRVNDPGGYAMDALELVGLQHKLGELPGNLSGGEQQRVAVARAIAHQPRILLADEPTGNVDSETSARIVELFAELNDMGSTVVMATHDEFVLSRFAARAVWLKQPRLEVAS